MLVRTEDNTLGVYTLSEFLEACSAPAAYEGNSRELENWVKGSGNGHEWMGLRGHAMPEENHTTAVHRIVREGWREGVKLMEEIADSITTPQPRQIRRVQRWQASGDDIDMQKVWHGEIETAWRGTHRDYRSGPARVRILVESIESGDAGANIMRWRGVGALKLADALTEAGYSVQVEGVIHCKDSSNDTKTFTLRTIIKDYMQPVDLLTMAACTALPAFFRSLMHTWGLAVANHKRFGVSYQVPKQTPAEQFADPNDDAPVVMFTRKCKDAKSTIKEIEKALQQIE